MSVHVLGACAAVALIAADPTGVNPPPKAAAKAAPAPEVSHTYLGEVTGTVVQAGDGSITLKVPEVVQTGTTRSAGGGSGGRVPHLPGMPSVGGSRRGSGVTVPKFGTKLVEVTYTLGDAVTVKTVAGKTMTLADVTAGGAARVHLERLREVPKPGEKTEPRVVVKSIDIPVPTPAKDAPVKK